MTRAAEANAGQGADGVHSWRSTLSVMFIAQLLSIVLVGRLTPKETYGKAYGLMASMTSLGMTLGPLAGGVMASHMGYRWPFVVVGLLLSLVVIPLILSVKR
ncbi:MAG: MFS transporter [Thermodesulfobacteriota bacterium]